MTKELKNRILENKVLTKDERTEIIKALETVEEFEKAQIITGGRLNGRTYAYKCGLEDGKRNALEQQPCEDLINQVNEQGNKKITNWLDNFFGMEFPKTFDEFANDYGFTDDKEIYTNGSHLIPVFRVKQWLDHIEQQPSEDCISRQAVLDLATTIQTDDYSGNEIIDVVEVDDIKALPPVTPTFPKGATNYDVLKTVFGSISAFRIKDTMEFEEGFEIWFSKPYKRGDLDGSN